MGEISALGFVLLAQLESVSDDLRLAVFAVLTGSEVALFNGALVAEALWPLQEQLHAFAPAEPAHCIFVSCQVFFSFVRRRSAYKTDSLFFPILYYSTPL